MNRFVQFLTYVTIALFVISIGIVVVHIVVLRNTVETPALVAKDVIAQHMAELEDALLTTKKVTLDQVVHGFWVSYIDPTTGVESLIFIDATRFAAGPLSTSELGELANIVARGRVIDRDNISSVAEDKLPVTLQFHNALYDINHTRGTTLQLKAELERQVKKQATPGALQSLSYVAELEGDYAKRDELVTKGCVRNPACVTPHTVPLRGTVLDSKGNPVQGAQVTVLSRPAEKITTITDQIGNYQLTVPIRTLEKIRIKAYKRNYSDGYANVLVVTPKVTDLSAEAIYLEAPVTIATVDYRARTTTGTGNIMAQDKTVTLRTDRSVYTLPYGALTTANGQSWRGSVVDVYLYEFSKANPPTSLMRLDTFDTVMGFAGDAMVTYGMPYIQFFDQETGEELHVLRSNPLTLDYRLSNMEALRTNSDKNPRALTSEDIRTLISYSRLHPYGVDREYLLSQNQVFPPFWVFDRRRGVWDNTGISVLTEEGDIRTKFYTTKD